MTRREQDREDLLAEATALVERVELKSPAFPDAVVAGFRKNGCASLYVGQDRAYHFNSLGELRRAYVDPLLYKAERGRWAALERRRSKHEVLLLHRDLEPDEMQAFAATLTELLGKLSNSLAIGDFELVRCVPQNANVLQRVQVWLAQLPQPLRVAASPHAR